MLERLQFLVSRLRERRTLHREALVLRATSCGRAANSDLP